LRGKDKSSSESLMHEGLPRGCSSTAFSIRFADGMLVGIPECGLLLGRSRCCDVVLADEDASRRHTLLRVLGGGLWVIDEGSTNGTLVNGEVVVRKRVIESDEILVGNSRVIVEAAPGELPVVLLEAWDRFLGVLEGHPSDAVDALRSLAAAEDCRLDPDGTVAINWAEGERGLDGLGPVRMRLVEDALGLLAGI